MTTLIPTLLNDLFHSSLIRTSRRRRITTIYNHIVNRTLSSHKTNDFEIRDYTSISINISLWASRFNCKNSSISNDLKFLVDNNILDCDRKSIIGKKSYWYSPSVKTLNSALIKVNLDPVSKIDNMETNIEMQIVKNVKSTKIQTQDAINYLKKQMESTASRYRESMEKGGAIHKEVCATKAASEVGLEQNKEEGWNNRAIIPNNSSVPYIKRKILFSPKIISSPISSEFEQCTDELVAQFSVDSLGWLQPRIYKLIVMLRSYREDNEIDSKKLKNPYRYISQYEKSLMELRHELGSLHYSINSTFDLHYGQYSISRSNTNRRIRHNIVEFPRHLRQFLYHDVYEIAVVDMGNSQPAIMVGMMIKQNADIEYCLIEAVANKTFYKDLQRASGLKDIDYDELKTRCLQFLYSQASYNLRELKNDRENIAKAFMMLYPKAFNWIIHRKQMFDSDQSKGKGKTEFNLEIQRAESSWMLGKVLRRLFHHNPNLWAVPMHDGCLIDRKFASKLEVIMLEEFENLYGFLPTVSIVHQERSSSSI